MVVAADRLAARAAFLRAFVLGHVLIETGKATERPATGLTVVLWLEFVIVAEHGRFERLRGLLG